MNPGDLKNTFVDKNGVEQTVVIPAAVFKDARRKKIANKVAIDQYLAELGYLDKTAVEETAKAKVAKPRTRKPNETKRKIVSLLEQVISQEYGACEVTNVERQIQFTIDGNVYELTLVQKRK